MARILYIALLSLFVSTIFSQNKKIVQYYGLDSTKIKNIIYVKSDSLNVLNGPFSHFFENGKPSILGKHSNNKPSGNWKYYYESGELKQEGIIIGYQKGYWKFYYENGKVMKEGKLDGNREEGFWTYYYENGHLRKSGDYFEGMKQGKWDYFYEDSVQKAVANFENGTGYYQEFYYDRSLKKEGSLVNGHSEGIWTYYYKNGEIKAKGLELDGSKNGYWEYYFKDGNKSSQGNYTRNRKDGEWIFYQVNGEIKTQGQISKGNRQGQWMTYNADGSFSTSINYKNNQGLYQEFYPNGQIKVSGQLVGAKHLGEWKYFYSDGQLEANCIYADNEGLYTSYYKNGTPKEEGQLIGTHKTGLWKLYGKDGKIVYLRTVYDKESSSSVIGDSLFIPNKQVTSKENNPKFIYKQPAKWKRNIRWLKPKPNEAKGFIIEVNPIGPLINQLPVSLEYFIQERLGYQLRYTFERDPFFLNHQDFSSEKIVTTGSSIDFTAKVYTRKFDHGMWFIGPNIKGSISKLSTNAFTDPDDLNNQNTEKISAQETTFQFSLTVGNRVVKSFKQSDFTLEVYTGLGVGYRDFDKKYDESISYYQSLFRQEKQGSIFIPFRIGFSIGYFFL